ncbi:MAG: hypothetical protein OXP70_10675 [Acidobacteriota bacterium]|nr:hypothetical protein [Acidobacteriota bacterium]
MRTVLALALSVLLIGSPAMGKVDLMAAAQEAGAAIRLCTPEDPMYIAGQAAAREFALKRGLTDAWTEGLGPPAEFLMAIVEEDRYCWSQGWNVGAEEKQSRLTTQAIVIGSIAVAVLIPALIAAARQDELK